jgi:hypothetical protein
MRCRNSREGSTIRGRTLWLLAAATLLTMGDAHGMDLLGKVDVSQRPLDATQPSTQFQITGLRGKVCGQAPNASPLTRATLYVRGIRGSPDSQLGYEVYVSFPNDPTGKHRVRVGQVTTYGLSPDTPRDVSFELAPSIFRGADAADTESCSMIVTLVPLSKTTRHEILKVDRIEIWGE